MRQLLLVGLWLAITIYGFSFVLKYETEPCPLASPPDIWPAAAITRSAPGTYSLLLAIHPHCPCSRASIAELASIMSHASNVHAYVLFLSPEGVKTDWEKTDLWSSASAIPHTTVISDKRGEQLALFNCKTSGQALLYDTGGHLKFNGGITSARGHQGDNAGRDAILSLARTGDAAHRQTLVFGCELNNKCGSGK